MVAAVSSEMEKSLGDFKNIKGGILSLSDPTEMFLRLPPSTACLRYTHDGFIKIAELELLKAEPRNLHLKQKFQIILTPSEVGEPLPLE